MNMKRILEYQELDKELRKHESEIERNEDSKSAQAARQAYNSAKAVAQQCGVDASRIIARFETLQKVFDSYSAKIDSCERKVENGVELEDIYGMVEELNALKEEFLRAERGVNDLARVIDEVQARYTDGVNQGRKNRAIYNQSMESYNAFVEAKTSVMQELKDKLEKMRPSIDPVIMNKYQQLRKEKIVPAFVPLIDSTRCGYCRIEQSKAVLAQLTADNTIECESCRRYIFLDK